MKLIFILQATCFNGSDFVMFSKGVLVWAGEEGHYEMLTKASTNYDQLVPGGMC